MAVVMTDAIQATVLTKMQLKMLDIGAPVIVACETSTGEIVHVRLQTENLDDSSAQNLHSDIPPRDKHANTHDNGCWETHGVYVAIMPDGVDYGG